MALGRTYNAISPRRLPPSMEMLAPQARQPASIHPWGPSRKLCDTQGKRRATNKVRTKQTVNQTDETKVERNEALRRRDDRVGKGSVNSCTGLKRRTGRMWTCKSLSKTKFV